MPVIYRKRDERVTRAVRLGTLSGGATVCGAELLVFALSGWGEEPVRLISGAFAFALLILGLVLFLAGSDQ